jgi:hypothetical protein
MQTLGPSLQSPKHIARETRHRAAAPCSFAHAFSCFWSSTEPRVAQASSPGSRSLQQMKMMRS